MTRVLKQPKAIFVVLTGLFFGVVALLLLSTNMQRGLSHDEHMYVAGGTLLAQGQLPYRDFPYLQMPNLAFIYAALFRGSDYLLLSARVFSTLAALGSLAIVFGVVSSWLRGAPYYARFLLAAGSVALMINSPIFGYTSGQAWNHDASLLFCLGAFAAYLRTSNKARRGGSRTALCGPGSVCERAVREPPLRALLDTLNSAGAGGVGKWTLLCGALVGLAVGTRLSFASVAPVFAVAVATLPPGAGRKDGVRRLAWFVGGVVLGLLPSLVMFALAPGGFVFGNLAYHEVNAEFWRSIGYTRAMDLSAKLGYLGEVVAQEGNLSLVLGTLGLGATLLLTRTYQGMDSLRGLWVALGLLVALLAGAFAPTPMWYQYFYAPLPFVVLALAYCASALYRRAVWTLGLFLLVVVLSFLHRPPLYPVENLLAPDRWVTVRAHRLGEEIKSYVRGGRVLTLAPMYPLEGGGGIYTDFAAGLFTWRSLTLLSQEELAASGLQSQQAFSDSLTREPPAAIFVGLQADLEAPWIGYAKARAYREVRLDEQFTLWLAP